MWRHAYSPTTIIHFTMCACVFCWLLIVIVSQEFKIVLYSLSLWLWIKWLCVQ